MNVDEEPTLLGKGSYGIVLKFRKDDKEFACKAIYRFGKGYSQVDPKKLKEDVLLEV